MAISDFFHCDNILDRPVDSHLFTALLAKARLVGNGFEFPNRRQVGGEFLDDNHGSCSDQNRILVGKDDNIFGL